MTQTSLTPEAEAAVRAAREGTGAYLANLLQAAYGAQGQVLPA